ncbi:hypothetical protein GCM10011378_22780 [Hymenobacter glacieicola]|uniref:DUF1232 domain-containing protein n=1 Tax=Hymenobacter glacieicola TaxID=1562124 RepID=A0ABQ1WV23_9BACT|nr:hypothetical protein GCM10011378_22780 [Hymenobacter glacieicola]
MDKQTPNGENIASSPLFKKFVGKAEEYIKKPTRMKQLLNDAYQKASEKNDVGSIAHEAWDTLQTLFRLIRTSVSGEYTGLPTTTVIAAVAVTIYFLSPIDVIPDFIPVLGLLDDVALVAWFSTTIKEEMDKFLEWERTRPSLVSDAVIVEDKVAASPSMPPVEAPPIGTTSSANTDSGISSPDSSKPAPASITDATPATNVTPHADTAANTTDSSREPHLSASSGRASGGDPGGNVR